MINNKYIKRLRESLLLNQEEFADKMAVDVSTVSRWERGVQKPKPVHLRRMVRLDKTAAVKQEEGGK